MGIKNIKKRIICFVMSLAIVFSCSVFVGADEKQDLIDVQNKIEQVINQINSNNTNISNLSKEILALGEKISKAQTKIDELTKSINDTKAKIVLKIEELNQKEAEITKQDEDLNARLRVMYKNGNGGILSVILNSTSITSLLTNIEMVKRIYASDSNLLYKMQEEYEVIYQAKLELSELKDSLLSQQAEVEKEKEALEADQQALTSKKNAALANNAELKAQQDTLKQRADALTAAIRELQGDASYDGGRMCWPSQVSTTVTSPFGTRYIFGGWSFHSGIDIGAWQGSNILAADDGVVLWTGWDPQGYGNYIMIDHGGGVVTLYGHSSKVLVYTGQRVKRGQAIALIGSTGLSTGPHLHFEIRINGSYQDPLDKTKNHYVVPGLF